jgi:serine/threonine protein kinase/DNA-binding SARP family transcriptional activator
MGVRLTTLGTPRVLLGEEELTSLPRKPVSFGLLVFLAVEREATRDRLVSVFWPEKSEEKARGSLSQTLYELKQVLGEGWVESNGAIVRVDDAVWADCLEFGDKAEAGYHSDAVELYQGPFLDGVHLAQTNPFQEWVDSNRARLGRRYRACANQNILDCRNRGDLDMGLRRAWEWVEMDSLDDGAQQWVIQLLAESGSRSEALAQFDRYAEMLDRELSLEPLDETLDLVDKIRAGDSRPDMPPLEVLPIPAGESPGVDDIGGESRPLTEPELQTESELPPDLEILRPIGDGNVAEVFLGREPHLKRLVAVKVLKSHLLSDPRALKRFEREAQAAANINHANVCTVLRVGTLPDGRPFLVSPFVKGATLGQRLKVEGRLSAEEVRRVLREMASALAAAHRIGILHRDVQPENVLRADSGGHHSLCDFGFAGLLETGEGNVTRITIPGEKIGDPTYMSPEQGEGEPPIDRSDIYSLGVLGYELLTGRTPFPVDGESGRKGRKGPAVEVGPFRDFMKDTDPDLAELICSCLAWNPTHRPSAEDVERRLEEDRAMVRGDAIQEITKVSLGRLVLRKRLPQILGAYTPAAWLTIEATDQFLARYDFPDWIVNYLWVSAPFGFVAATIIGWFHGEKGPQAMDPMEKGLLWLLALGWLVAIVVRAVAF